MQYIPVKAVSADLNGLERSKQRIRRTRKINAAGKYPRLFLRFLRIYP